MDKKLVIFIPAFDEEKTIGKVIRNLPKHLNGISDIRVLVVDDGSEDNTAKIAGEAGAIVISHTKNRGVGGAFHTAVDKALDMGADILVSIDADGQFNACDIPLLIKPILEGKAEFVTGNRFEKGRPKNMFFVKYWGNKCMNRLVSRIAKIKLRDSACGFRAYSSEALLNLNLNGKFTYTQETILDLAYKGLRIHEVPVGVTYFKDRKSRVAGSICNYALRSLNIILKSFRDYKPLKFFGYGGILIFAVGLAFDIFVLVHYAKTGQFTPYKAIGVAGGILNVIGIISFMIGFLADMLGTMRINQEKLLYYQKKKEYEKNK